MESEQIRAAEYMRMSTEHQQYSIANQSAAIQEYANSHSIKIVGTYIDPGGSGLSLKGRAQLQALLKTVISGTADFNLVLVYDVSRWGRFQDVDESAYYEYTLKKAGIRVIYCAEPFRDTGSPTDALIKTLKRAMAAEYSRELSVKVTQGQRRIAESGYRLGGVAGFGFRRVAVDPSGSRKIVLEDGERKGIANDRVKLTTGSDAEVQTVQEVFSLFVNDGLGETQIANLLNKRGILTKRRIPWTREPIYRMLRNPKYVGDLAYNRTVSRLGSPPVANPRDKWVFLPDQFPPIVSRDIWNAAQQVFTKRAAQGKEEDMLDHLRALLASHGHLSYDLIDAEPGMMAAQTYQHRFGSIAEAYRRVGWTASKRGPQITRRPEVRECRLGLEGAMTARIGEASDYYVKHPKNLLWTINGELSLRAALLVPIRRRKHRVVWTFRGSQEGQADLVVLARLNIEATAILDYYVFPGCSPTPIRIFEQNPGRFNLHRFEDLGFLDLICRRTRQSEVGGADV